MKNKIIFGSIASGKSTYARLELLELARSDCSWIYDIEVLSSGDEYDRINRRGLKNMKLTKISENDPEKVIQFLREYKDRILQQSDRIANNLTLDYFYLTDEIFAEIFEMLTGIMERVNVSLVYRVTPESWDEFLHKYEGRFRSMDFDFQTPSHFYNKVTEALKDDRIRRLIG